MENKGKSWLAGCGCGCLGYAGLCVLFYGLTIGVAYVLWEVFDVRERFLRGESVLTWGPAVAVPLAFILGIIIMLVVQRIAFKRFEKSSPSAPGGAAPAAGGPAPVGSAPGGPAPGSTPGSAPSGPAFGGPAPGGPPPGGPPPGGPTPGSFGQ